MAYTSSNLAGIQAAVAAGMGLSILSEMAIQTDHRVLTAKDGFAPIDRTEVALVASSFFAHEPRNAAIVSAVIKAKRDVFIVVG